MSNEILRRRFDVDVPPRCSLHQCVKNAYDPADRSRRCIFCKHYTLSLKAQTCLVCLGTEHLENFDCDDYVKDKAWYQYNVGRPEEGET